MWRLTSKGYGSTLKTVKVVIEFEHESDAFYALHSLNENFPDYWNHSVRQLGQRIDDNLESDTEDEGVERTLS